MYISFDAKQTNIIQYCTSSLVHLIFKVLYAFCLIVLLFFILLSCDSFRSSLKCNLTTFDYLYFFVSFIFSVFASAEQQTEREEKHVEYTQYMREGNV